ncbi:predicted protein [Sclerotinia sclerotiorum 1980 UF-70]|uniref:Uncharacterized protein n=1 Tax=Sclerotinia sclerotiorum (strain ATCC 18683 / 1980 / Ss-1) TaxID=665079 RepID=A7EVC0_SCLS1|nr:predicted protein [Sclerotinia sclerotiorum 1980 UF-70]EDN93412.1 predicted protein [Sclerotinia sclerotiorum 1980 UF-70]
MFRFTTTFALAILCLTKSSCSRPISKPEKGKPFDINPQIPPRLDAVGNVGCSTNAAGVDVNPIHLPLIPSPNIKKSFQERSVELPLSGRSLRIKRAVPLLVAGSINGQSFIPLPTLAVDAVTTISSNTTGLMTATYSSIPSWSTATMFISISTSSDFIGPVTAIDSNKKAPYTSSYISNDASTYYYHRTSPSLDEFAQNDTYTSSPFKEFQSNSICIGTSSSVTSSNRNTKVENKNKAIQNCVACI